jgi:transposase
MIKKDRRTTAKGITKTQIRVVEAYRPGPGLPPKQRTIRDFGILEEQEDREAFMAAVEEFNENFKKEKEAAPMSIEAPGTAKMYSGSNQKLNYGYGYLDAVYAALGIEGFIRDYGKSGKHRDAYSSADIFRFLVLLRILSPDSKRASCQVKNGFYGMDTDFALSDVYRALDRFCEFEVELQRYLNERVKELIGRDLSYAFFDVTNYFFEIDFPEDDDDLRRNGVSKEHRCDPIVAMGLFMDGNGLPVSMSIFPGNTSDTKTLKPVMEDVKESYGLGRIIVVADKGLNSSDNINTIIDNGDGFIFSQILKGKKGKRYASELFNDEGWIAKSKDYRYKIFDGDYTGLDKEGKKVTRKRRVLLYWNKADADMARRKREEKLRKAEKAIGNNAYAIKHGYEEYTKEDIVDKGSGQYLENIAKVRSVNREKAEKDAVYDGYFCIVTSETDYDETQIRKAYHGLWRIEESFRIMKSDLYARPVFVRKNEHIRAHFLICFTALLILRIMQHRMGESALSAERIARALNAATCREHKGGIIHLDDVGGAIAFKKTADKHGRIVDTLEYSDDDEIALDYGRIQKTFGTDFYNVFARVEVFNKFLKSITLA